MAILNVLIFVNFLCFGSKTVARPATENLDTASSHRLVWKNENTTLDESLRSNVEPGDFFYLFTGDTQHFHACTEDNRACKAQTPDCKTPLTDQCIEKQSQWANRYQQISMRKLLDRLASATGQVPKALVINGDLAEMGTQRQLDTYRTNWENFDQRFPVYPGLGNHDYANNVDQCENNHCVNRVLSYFTKYAKDKLGKSVDVKNETTSKGNVISGSLSYSWDECVGENACFHFTQENNYPTYTREIVSNVSTWKIQSSLTWLENDLKQKSGWPTILNFHDFDTMFSEAGKRDFKNVLINGKAEIVAVFFAHVHEKVGLRSHWCLEKQSRPIWFIYSGSVPGSNYVLAHLSPRRKSLKALYKVHVANETTSYVEAESLSATCSKSGSGTSSNAAAAAG